MASLSLKDVTKIHYDPNIYFETYFCESGFRDDALLLLLKQLKETFALGGIKSDTLFQVGISHIILYLLTTHEYVKEIFVADVFDSNIQELEKWMKKEPGAIDFSQLSGFISEIDGKSEPWMEKEDTLRSKITQVARCDLSENNPLTPLILPQVDCLLLPFFLGHVCFNIEMYCTALKNLSALLKTGAHLLIIECLGSTFLMIGKLKYPSLCIDEAGMRQVLSDAGFGIEKVYMNPRLRESLYAIDDFNEITLIIACKERDM